MSAMLPRIPILLIALLGLAAIPGCGTQRDDIQKTARPSPTRQAEPRGTPGSAMPVVIQAAIPPREHDEASTSPSPPEPESAPTEAIEPVSTPAPATPTAPTAKTPPAVAIKRSPTRHFKADRSDLDSRGPAYRILQNPREAMRDFPVDDFGIVDWVQALNDERIAPRASIVGGRKMLIKRETVIMKDTRQMPWVRFPHLQHTQWLACGNCHPKPFKEKQNDISMDSIMRGRHCGLCHGKVAFPILQCERCHNVTHPGSPKRWW